MRKLVDVADLLKHERRAGSYGPEMLVVGKGFILDAPTHAGADSIIKENNDKLADALERAETAERELARTREQTQWHPIETAPKDGSRVLLINKKYPLRIYNAEWLVTVDYDGKPEAFWYGVRETGVNTHVKELELSKSMTHWMPAPAAPATGGEGGEQR